MRDRYRERAETGFFVDSAPSPDRRGLPRYAGIGPLAELAGEEAAEEPRAWIYVRATPRPARFAAETPFPRVLAPADLFGLDDDAVAYAEYDDGVRARGGDECQEEAVFSHGSATVILDGSDCVLEANHQCSGHVHCPLVVGTMRCRG